MPIRLGLAAVRSTRAFKSWTFLKLASVILFVTTSAVCDSDYTIWIPRSPNADPLYRFVKDGKAGYIDATGAIVIPASLPDFGGNGGGEFHDGRLEIAVWSGVYADSSGRKVIDTGLFRGWDFSEGLAPALEKEGGKWGYINTSGEFAISPRFPGHPGGYVSSFAEGLAAIEIAGKVGYIDHSGSFVVAPKYLDGRPFRDGKARVVADGPCACQRGSDLIILPRNSNPSGVLPACKYSFIDRTGSILSEARYDDALDFSDGIAPVRIGDLWGYIDKQGRMLIPPQFNTAAPFSDGFALVSERRLYGYIDRSGSFTVKPQFKYAEDFVDGLAVVGEPSSKYWYINHTGNKGIDDDFAVASPFFKGIAHVKIFTGSAKDTVWGVGSFAYINQAGKIMFREER